MSIDTDRLAGLAAEVRHLAEALGREADDLPRRVDDVPWRGHAAEAFRAAAADHLGVLLAATEEAQAAARSLEEHAARVDHRRAEMARAAGVLVAGTVGLGGVVAAVVP